MSLLKRLEGQHKKNDKAAGEPKAEHDPYLDLKEQIFRSVIERLEKEDVTADEVKNTQVFSSKVENIISEILLDGNEFIVRKDRQKLVQDILYEITGYGPIQALIDDESVSEIMVNGPRKVYVERKGKLVLSEVKFKDDAHILRIIEKIVAPIGRRIDESMPMVDARLPDGSRVNAIIPPLALDGPSVTIRKFAKDPLTVENLISFGSLTEEMALFLEACVKARLNVVVSGGTGSGKTTTLNVLSSFIPEDERIVTIEDAAELQLRQEHIVRLESRPPNIEGKGAITIRDLVRNSLRMRPERIVIGECRSGEALDMLQAMNTGHDGSLTTGHANSPRDMLARLETMVLMSGMELPVRAIREQIASAIDLIVQQSRLKDGTRKITHITEVLNMEGDVIVLQDLFYYEQMGVDERNKLLGRFRPTGIRPKFMDKLESSGINLPHNLFAVEW